MNKIKQNVSLQSISIFHFYFRINQIYNVIDKHTFFKDSRCWVAASLVIITHSIFTALKTRFVHHALDNIFSENKKKAQSRFVRFYLDLSHKRFSHPFRCKFSIHSHVDTRSRRNDYRRAGKEIQKWDVKCISQARILIVDQAHVVPASGINCF